MNKQEMRKMKREKGVLKVMFDSIRKQVKGMCDDRNNAHHNGHLIPEYCRPSGMHGWSKVVIKDKYVQDLYVEGIENTLDILAEQFDFAIEDVYNLEEKVKALTEENKPQDADTHGTFANKQQEKL